MLFNNVLGKDRGGKLYAFQNVVISIRLSNGHTSLIIIITFILISLQATLTDTTKYLNWNSH